MFFVITVQIAEAQLKFLVPSRRLWTSRKKAKLESQEAETKCALFG